jgi:hypothetical protein
MLDAAGAALREVPLVGSIVGIGLPLAAMIFGKWHPLLS